MEILLLGIYSFFVWLIFIKLKWLPWNIATQVIVVIIPIVGLGATILLLNIFAPSSSDAARDEVHRAHRLAGARPGDRGAGRGRQPPGEEGRGAVPHRSRRPTSSRSTCSRRSSSACRARSASWRSRRRARSAKIEEPSQSARDREISARLALTRKRVAQYRELVEDRRRQPASTWSAPRPTPWSSRASSTPRATPRRRRARACARSSRSSAPR